MAKLNLNALKINNNSNIDNNSPNLEIKPEEKKVEIEERTISKKKFSLKELSISGTKKENNTNENISSENIIATEIVFKETELKNEPIVKIEEEPKKAKIGLKSIIKTETTNENKNEPEIKKDDSQEVKVLSISDGDTNCNMIIEKKSEIFGNYKGSYTQENQEEEKKPEKEIIQDIKVQETKKTNLESYSKGNIENKKNKSKKITLTSIFTIISLSLLGFFIIESGLLKSNIQETKKEKANIEVKNEETKNEEITENNNSTIENTQETPIANEIQTTEETPIVEENIESVTDNDIKVEENEIVKENLENSIDNNTNYNRINEKVKIFLLKKYKNKYFN